MNAADLIHPDDLPTSRQVRDQLFGGEISHFSDERRYRHALGHTVWARAEVTVVQGAGSNDDAPYLLAQLQDTSTRKSYEQQLEYLANHDVLTGVLNRRGLTSVLERQASLTDSRPYAGSVLICDLDHFKAVNDELGHEAGDELLQHLARQIQKMIGPSDVVGRLGGDEFAVILPHLDLAAARAIGEDIARCLDEAPSGALWAGAPVSVSVGAAQFSTGDSVDQVLRIADQAMYAAKAASRRLNRHTGDLPIPAS